MFGSITEGEYHALSLNCTNVRLSPFWVWVRANRTQKQYADEKIEQPEKEQVGCVRVAGSNRLSVASRANQTHAHQDLLLVAGILAC